MKSCVLFDFDGVIINSEPVIKAAFTLSFRDIVGRGEPPVREYLSHMGDSFDRIMSKMSLPTQMYPVFRDYSTRLSNLIEVFPGISELLRELRSEGVATGLVTGKDRRRVDELIEVLGLPGFDAIVGGDEIENPKPHPQPLLRALDMLGVQAEQAWMIGDSPNDIVAARSAGVSSCAVTWGIGSRRELEDVKPDVLVSSPAELRSLLLKAAA
ncbi:HAD family hydrolase [Parasulfuritortus cantonensis]|uniref:phosphoglycolate phosphatase n=1 Tax=Parasulfuritortus cantonensis TaxID=2528202 RepID=A0A4R1BDZ5_9PROT|nr:HAD-IA family hydrolase [Parasulfuritortus cantonensis]TCJ15218.1 HAD family hydrolase [Parasulfuritortus cantonensis]